MRTLTAQELQEIPRGIVAEASAPLPIIQFPDGHTEPAPAGSVLAEDIIGQLTSDQIEEIEAAKVSGKLTSEQIENINAGQIIGEIVESQIKGIGAGKIKGFIEGTQIAAETITGGNILALTITAGKIATNAIIAEKIAAGAVTTAKLAAESIIAEKISAGAITTVKIAAGAITAEKLNVKELSAIVANLGTITSGTITGTNLIFEEGTAALHRVRWLKGVVEKGGIFTTEEPPAHTLWLEGKGTKSGAALSVTGADEAGIGASVGAVAVEGEAKNSKSVTIITSAGISSFMQLAGVGRIERDFGKVTALPKEPIDGDRCKFVADKAKGITWDLRYNSETKYWEVSGGESLFAEVIAGQSTASAVYVNLATVGPELKFPLAGDYRLEIGAALWNNTSNCHARMGISINGAAPTVEIDTNQPTAGAFSAMNCYRKVELLNMVSGQSLLAKYQQISGGEAAFTDRWIAIRPVRVK